MPLRRLLVPGADHRARCWRCWSRSASGSCTGCSGSWTAGAARRAPRRAAPVPLPADPQPLQKVRARGQLAAGSCWPTYGAEVRDTSAGPAMGAQLLMPLATATAASSSSTAAGFRRTRLVPLTTPGGTATVVGWLRADRSSGPVLGAGRPGRAAILHPRSAGDRDRARRLRRSCPSCWWHWRRVRSTATRSRPGTCRARPTTIWATRSPGSGSRRPCWWCSSSMRAARSAGRVARIGNHTERA